MSNTLSSLWEERYREPRGASEASFSGEAVLASLLSHRSVRAYLPIPIAQGVVEMAVAAASSAATSLYLQMWSVIAIEDPVRRARLADLSGQQKHVSEAPLFLVWVADLSRVARIAERQNRRCDGLLHTEMGLMAVIDVALAAQNAVVALEAQGLGTVYIGGLRNHPVAVAEELGLPKHSFAVFGLCVGHPDPAHPAQIRPRLPQAIVLHRERYDSSREAATLPAFDVRSSAFQVEQGLPARNWTEMAVSRVETREVLEGRDKLPEELKNLDYPLK